MLCQQNSSVSSVGKHPQVWHGNTHEIRLYSEELRMAQVIIQDGNARDVSGAGRENIKAKLREPEAIKHRNCLEFVISVVKCSRSRLNVGSHPACHFDGDLSHKGRKKERKKEKLGMLDCFRLVLAVCDDFQRKGRFPNTEVQPFEKRFQFQKIFNL